MAVATEERPLSTILHDILGNVQEIVRSEARLAKAELASEAKKSTSGALMLGAGVFMLGFSGLFALLAIVFALSMVMPAWAAALIVAAGEGLMAAVFVGIGIRKLRAVRAVPKTAASVKETVEWAKHPTR